MKVLKFLTVAGVLALAMVFAALPGAMAQDKEQMKEMLKNSTPQQRADMQTKLMQQELSLTDAQYTGVSKLNLEYANKMQVIINSDEGRIGKARKAKSLMGEKEKKLKGILTDEQFEKYKQYVKEKVEQLKSYRNG